jgi:4,5-DOPA dioxygenase extradiol
VSKVSCSNFRTLIIFGKVNRVKYMPKMPILFVGHGSPMNAIEENSYTQEWKNVASKIPTPKAILAISAHWYTKGTKIMNEEAPKTIYDMYGFPKELYEIVFDHPGSPNFAEKTKQLLSKETVFDNSWGIDHGTWSVLVHMFSDKEIPVFQLSIDALSPPEVHFKMGQELKALRQQGVLIFGSGNIVHNLGRIDWDYGHHGFDWAEEFDSFIYDAIIQRNPANIINFHQLGQAAKLAVPTPDHFYPLLYILGASEEADSISVFNRSCELGSLSMTSYLWESLELNDATK